MTNSAKFAVYFYVFIGFFFANFCQGEPYQVLSPRCTTLVGTCTSDSRLKKNIVSLNGALDKIVQLNPSFYNWRNDEYPQFGFGTATQLGLIAQDVEQVLPELVKTGEDGFKRVSYGNELQMYTIKAIKELNAKMDNMLTLDATGNIVSGTAQTVAQPAAITTLTAAQLTTQEQLDAINNVLGMTDTSQSSASASLLSRVTTLETSTSSTADDIASLKSQVTLLKELIGINTAQTSQSTETSQSSSTISTPSQFLAEMTSTFNNFKDFIAALGLSATADKGLLVSTDLNVLGKTTLANLTVTGDLTAGSLIVNTMDTSINFNGPSCYNDITGVEHTDICSAQTVYIQKNLAGNVDIFNGKMVLEPNGTLTVKGTVAADKVVSDEFAVRGTSKNVGSAVLKANETTVVVASTSVKTNSKIFVTAPSSTNGQALIVTNKLEGESFMVTVNAATVNDTTFDWWVLNVE